MAVSGIQRRVFDNDVRRVAHHGVVLAAQNALHLGQVFAGVGVGQAGVGVGLGGVKQVLALRQAKAGAVQQAVANGYRHLEVVRIGQALHARGLQGGDKQAKARNGDGKGVQIDPGHGVQRFLRHVHRVAAWLVALPLGQQAVKAAQQKVARTTGGVDQAYFAEAELVDGRCERAVENELFHKLGRLQQGVALARGLAQVLVQVAQKAGVPGRVGKVVLQGAGVGVHLPPKFEQRHGGIAADAEAKNRVVRLVKKGLQAGQVARFAEGGQQVVAVAFVRVGLKVGVVPVARQRQTVAIRA